MGFFMARSLFGQLMYFCRMQRIFLHIAFHGGNYHGWQRQPNGISVQEVMEESLGLLLRSPISVTGCGRTDTGVHARNFYLHLDVEKPLSLVETEQLAYRLNRMLPADIAVYRAFPVRPELHARFSAISRTYIYYISRTKNPFFQDTAWEFTGELDIVAMNDAAELLVTTTDFSCFSKAHTQVKTNVCKVSEAFWEEKDGLLVFRISADRFLRNMVRAIVGTLMEVGKGRMRKEGLRQLLAEGNRSAAGESVAAKGLFLEDVRYPEGSFLE